MRRLFFILCALLAVSLLVVGTLPWWLEGVLRRVGASQGATFSSYERAANGRFVLADVVVDRPNVQVTIDRLEAPLPLTWLWGHRRGDESNRIAAGTLRIEVGEEPRTRDSASGWMPIRSRLTQLAGILERWLPLASLEAGELRWPGGVLQWGRTDWRDNLLVVKAVRYRDSQSDAEVRWAADDDSLSLTLVSLDAAWRAAFRSQGAVVTGELALWSQPAHLDAAFAATGWLPVEAELAALDWQVDGARINLGDRYRQILGSGRVIWRDTRLDVDVTATGEPVAGQAAPPLSVALRGTGTREAFTLSTLDLRIPGVTAGLSAPVTFDPGAGSAGVQSVFTLDADLEALPWSGWRGTLRGEATVRGLSGALPAIDASLAANGVGFRDWEVSSASGRVDFQWPRLRLVESEVVSVGGGRLDMRGEWNFQTSSLANATVTGSINRAALAPWLPSFLDLVSVEGEATASGTWPELSHTGRISVAGLDLPQAKPVALDASWHGRGPALSEIELTARSAESAVVSARGSLSASGVDLQAGSLTDRTGRVLTLAAPVLLKWDPVVVVESLRLAGSGTEVELSFVSGQQNRVALAVAALDSRWFEPWIEIPGPAWNLGTLQFSGEWSDGPLRFTADARIHVALSETRMASISVAATGDGSGVVVRDLNATDATDAVLRATARLPVVFAPAREPRMRIEQGGPLELTASSEPNPAFWEKLAELTGVTLVAPQVRANLSGTWSEPRGELRLNAEAVGLDSLRWSRAVPEISDLRLRLTGDDGGLRLDEFHVGVAGQVVRATGMLPLMPGRWEDVRRNPRAFIEENADLRIEAPAVNMAALARYLPGYLAPVGQMEIDVAIKPGGVLSGFLRLQGAASRPLGPLGVLQEIGADVRFEGRDIELRSVTAKAGGQPVVLSGTVTLPVNGEPELDLSLKGENIPFVRQTGLLVRGDLDLKLASLADGGTRISGLTRLRDSLFLSDVRALIPRGGGGSMVAARRPPYFSVEVSPLNAWQLDVDVQGDRFLRLRTPVFNGTASARFRLRGTLGEPRATGEATVNEGRVLLPFATFAVQQGSVRLTEADPFEPRIALTGTSRRFGYDLRMNLGGTVSAPDLSFTSSPPLESEQVLLLVMAGEAPGDEIRYSGNQRAVRFGAYLGQGLIGRLGGDTANADRLSLTTGERVSRQGRETYGFEYKLDTRWSLVGEYDEFDDFNAGVKWRILAREEATDEAAP